MTLTLPVDLPADILVSWLTLEDVPVVLGADMWLDAVHRHVSPHPPDGPLDQLSPSKVRALLQRFLI